MVIGSKVYFRNGPCRIVYQTEQEVVLERVKDGRLFLWSKGAFIKWLQEKRKSEQDERKKSYFKELAEKLLKKKEEANEKESKGKESGKVKKSKAAAKNKKGSKKD